MTWEARRTGMSPGFHNNMACWAAKWQLTGSMQAGNLCMIYFLIYIQYKNRSMDWKSSYTFKRKRVFGLTI